MDKSLPTIWNIPKNDLKTSRVLKSITFQMVKRLWTTLCLIVIFIFIIWIHYEMPKERNPVPSKEHILFHQKEYERLKHLTPEQLKTIRNSKHFEGKLDQSDISEVKDVSFSYSDENSISKFEQIKNNEISETEQIKRFPSYYEDDLRPGWKFEISKNYNDHVLHLWSEPVDSIFVRNLTGNGENGNAYNPTSEEKPLIEKLHKIHNYNLYATEHMSLHRSLPDHRFSQCRQLSYPEKLPTVSVIIILHDEAWSTLLRTVWSIIDRSPRELLEEIILVDDVSSWPNLKRPLDDYIEMLPVRIKIIRNTQREGLIRSRLIGAKAATGSVLTFFDAHMECNVGWLEPTLARIANDRSVVVVPLIDGIDSSDMGYYGPSDLYITGLRWDLIFNWIPIPEREKLRTQNDPTAPIRTPTHIGCAFSIDREFFYEIGSYDEEMNIWGSENVELALRVWLCGGSLEIVPCSRVGHLFRVSTYSFNGDANLITTRNNVRLVEVWMDQYKHLFYAANPHARRVPPGNITERLELKKRLQCKNFRWYLDNIHPENTFGKEFISMGELRSVSHNICLDNAVGTNGRLITYNCHEYGGNQFFAHAKSGQIVQADGGCISIKDNYVILVVCSDNDGNQFWNYSNTTKLIVHRATNKCIRNHESGVIIDNCDSTESQFQWNFVPIE